LSGTFKALAEEDTITLYPMADTFIHSNEENAIFGTSQNMEVYYYYEPIEYIEDNETRYAVEDYSYTYIMFDLTKVPTNFLVDHASLRLYAWLVVYPIDVGSFLLPTNMWNEKTLNWNNAPMVLGYSSDNVYVSSGDITYSWDVTDFVRTTLGIYNLTIVLKPTMSGEGIGYAFFSTREETNHVPQLIINGKYEKPSDPLYKPDLTITGIVWNPTEPKENEQIAFQACIENYAGEPSLSTTRVDLYVDDEYVGYSEIGPIDVSGVVKTYPITINSLVAGMHFVRAIVDPTDAIAESNEYNNELQAHFIVEAVPEERVIENGPDLIITEITWDPEDPSYEDQIIFYVYVKNCGNEPSVSIFDVNIRVNGEYQGKTELGIVKIGETKRTNSLIVYPLSEGIHTVTAMADSEDSVSEIDENNNEYATEIDVIPEFPLHVFLAIFFVVTLIIIILKPKFKRAYITKL